MHISDFQKKHGDCQCKFDQIPGEFDWMLDRFQKLNPKRICEIGSWHGGTLFYWLKYSPDDATVVSVDVVHGHLHHTTETGWANFEAKDKLRLITGSSASSEIRQTVVDVMPKIDFLFVDGDHTRAGLQADLQQFGPLVRPGGIIAIHDVNPLAIEAQEQGGHGVARVWSEIKRDADDSYDCEEISLVKTDVHLGSYGIGVINVRNKFSYTAG